MDLLTGRLSQVRVSKLVARVRSNPPSISGETLTSHQWAAVRSHHSKLPKWLHLVEVTIGPSPAKKKGKCGKTTFNKKTYKLLNLHLHSPSEHQLNGTSISSGGTHGTHSGWRKSCCHCYYVSIYREHICSKYRQRKATWTTEQMPSWRRHWKVWIKERTQFLWVLLSTNPLDFVHTQGL